MKKIKSLNTYVPYFNSIELKIPIFSKILNIDIQDSTINLIYEFDSENEGISKSIFVEILKGSLFEYSKLEFKYFSTIVKNTPKITITSGGDSASFKMTNDIEYYNIFINDVTIQEKRDTTIESLNE